MKEKIFFEAKVKKSKSPISKVVEDLGINYPNESLGFLHAVYAKVDGKTPNKNKVILAKTVKDDVSQLRFTQANINHKRAGYVIGTILDSWVNDKTDEIEIVFSFYKSLYPSQWETVEKAIEDGEMSVSFELMVEKEDIVYLNDGVRKLKQVTFDGVGLLFPGVTPAYPNAKVLESANAIISSVFDNKTLLCASVKEAVNKIEIMLAKITKGTNKMDKKLKDALMAKFKEEVTVDLGEEAVKDWSEEQWEAELEKRASAEDEAKAEETVEDEAKAEETVEDEAKAEETVEAKEDYECKCVDCGKIIKSSEHCKDIKCSECGGEMRRKDRPGDGQNKASEEPEIEKVVMEREAVIKEKVILEPDKETVESDSEIVTKRDGKEITKEKVKTETVYTYAQVEEIKAKYEKEIKFLKENAKQVISVRAELGDFVKDLADEDLLDETKLENARLKKRIAELEGKPITTASDESEEDLITGHDEASQVDEETSDERIGTYLKDRYNK